MSFSSGTPPSVYQNRYNYHTRSPPHEMTASETITFKNRLVQYVGCITRPHPDKTDATVHDYHDELTPVLASSLRKRAPGYTKLGFPDPRTAQKPSGTS